MAEFDANIGSALVWAKNILNEFNIKDADLSAEILLSEITGIKRLELYAHFDGSLKLQEKQNFESYINRRLKHEPIQHILGYTYFYGSKIFVNKDVLIPRQETETLVEICLKENTKQNLNVLDLCCGSGCIAIAIANKLKNAQVLAVDYSKKALNIAEKNIAYNNLSDRISLLQADILNDIVFENNFDLIISNPPYVPVDILKSLDKEVLDFEPIDALAAGDNGLDFVEPIIRIAKRYLNEDGIFAMEFFESSGNYVVEYLKQYGFEHAKLHKDLNNLERFVVVKN